MKMKKIINTWLIPVVVIVASLGIAKMMINQREQPTRSEQDSVTPLVQVLTVKSHEVTPVLEAFGEVRAHREVQIQAQVSGITTVIDDRLIVGGIFKSGEELMRIQPIDFELAVDQREADLALARMQHELELGRQEVAKREWQLLGDKQPVEASRKRLALRVPQLRQAEIALTAAESALQRAQLDLDRTIIRSPFNASVLSENAEKGQLITATGNICRLVCTDDYYVITSLPQNMARHIRTLEDHGIAAKARIHTPGSGMREGTVIRFLSDLESNSRMARVVVEVKDPLALEDANTGREKLFLGSFVKLEIELPTLQDAIRVPRTYVRPGDTVWVWKDEQLEIRNLAIRHRESEDLIITKGLVDGDQVITSSLPVATPGMRVRREEPQ